MNHPPFLNCLSITDYKAHFEKVYCRGTKPTFDGYRVRFRKSDFGHAFYESSCRDSLKDKFSIIRARRMDWIEATLLDPTSELRIGYDNKRKRHDRGRRVAIVKGNYVVIISIISREWKIARFITAFVAAGKSLAMILANPRWK